MRPMRMPSLMLKQKGITAIVMKAGRASTGSSQLIFAMGDIIIMPTTMSAGAVAAAGMARNRGAQTKDGLEMLHRQAELCWEFFRCV